MSKKNWVQQLLASADLSGEAVPGIPVVELLGDQRVLIERHEGVTQYSDLEIRVKVSYGCICITGSKMELAAMTKAHLVITGRIESLALERGEKP